MSDFVLNDYVSRSANLLQTAKKIFEKYNHLGLNAINPDNLPKTMQPADGAIKLVFVGQYSSGKSSIIKMLSGIDTEIGSGIKTQEAQSYKWGDLEIVDTPGIHTELRPDHDEKTYYQINHAALLVFVVTNEGFDNRMGNHFRKLAIEQDRAKNMVLVVNKMDRTTLGNVKDQQDVIANDMLKVITPYKPSDVYLSFLDTESYFSWQEETDPEMKEIYLEQSGYQPFVNNLNNFVKSRGVLSRILTPLETLKSAITTVIGKSDDFDVDKDIEALEALLKGKKSKIADAKRQIDVEIEEIAFNCSQKIKTLGAEAIAEIRPGRTEAEIKSCLEDAQHRADIFIKDAEAKMIARFSEICEETNQEISAYDNSDFAVTIQTNFSSRSYNLPTTSVNTDASNIDMMNSFKNAQLIGTTAKDAAKLGINNLPGVGSLKAADAVKGIGHLFNVKFAPWGAVNIVKGLSIALGVVSVAYSLYQFISNNDKQREMEEAIHKAQNEVRNQFNAVAQNVYTEMNRIAKNEMNKITEPALREVDEKLSQFYQKKHDLKNMAQEMKDLLGEVNTVMADMQKTAMAV